MEAWSMPAHNRLPRSQNGVGPANAVTAAEVEKLIKVAKDDQYGRPDVMLILIAFRSASRHLRAPKNSKPLPHPLRGDEIRTLRELRRQFHESSSPASVTVCCGLPARNEFPVC
jgi:hypothetical protein